MARATSFRWRSNSPVTFPYVSHLIAMAKEQTAIFGGGCFWCIEAVLQRLTGVTHVESGYMGGHVDNPTYRQVCNGDTGHVEVVRVTFDPDQISFRELLDVFFSMHDPTTLNRQGNDAGEQYRSVIFYTNEEQQRIAEDVIAEMTAAEVFPEPIVTAVEPASKFYVAEDYHQNYYNENSRQPYCMFVISPKVAKLEKKFAEKLRA
jgi:peptide-methionine (S)-S-oxide reductase